MPNTWEKKMEEQGYNYLDGLVQAKVELFEIRIENYRSQFLQEFPQQTKNEEFQEKESPLSMISLNCWLI